MQLAWKPDDADSFIAHVPNGYYRVSYAHHDGYRVVINGVPIGTRRLLDDAKLLAQQHNDRR